eukprot:2147212-Rhodomonas_salina.1
MAVLAVTWLHTLGQFGIAAGGLGSGSWVKGLVSGVRGVSEGAGFASVVWGLQSKVSGLKGGVEEPGSRV